MCAQLTKKLFLNDLEDGLWTVFVPINDTFRNAFLEMTAFSNMTDILLGHTKMNEFIPFDELMGSIPTRFV